MSSHLLFAILIVGSACTHPVKEPDPDATPSLTRSARVEPAVPRGFWPLVDASVRKSDGPRSVRAFQKRLAKLSPEEVLTIHHDFSQELARSYTWKLWGAAYVISGGCSDDCFDYFRAWLIMQGRTTFEAALRDPDSLAEYPYLGHPPELEEALSATRKVYRALAGKEPENDVLYPELGSGWDFDDSSEMKKRYPKLCKRFGC